ncbi:MAG: Na/Pi cotransporter family protein [Acetivibrionales bacterium]|jgi:phosphate:Na+ symporter
MKLFYIILYNFIIGTLCLIFGVNTMSGGLEKINPTAIRKTLSRFTGSIPSALLTGTVLTALVQSSTAVTVTAVGLVNSGLMTLAQSIGIIYGANIGTTITTQLMSLRITDTALPLLAAGFLIKILSKKSSFRYIGHAIIGFGFMFLGLGILNSGVPYLKESKQAYELFRVYGENPIIGIVIGMLTTMLVHSSSATVGITIVLFNSHLISFNAALCLTLGDNIGTCITAQIASIGTSVSARRTAWAHTLYNVIGVLIALVLLHPFSNIVQYLTTVLGQSETRLVANAHTIFNVISAVLFLPFTKLYVRFIEWIVPEKK